MFRDVCVVLHCRRRRQKAELSATTSSGSDATDATRVCDRRLTGSTSASALGYFETATPDDVWHSGQSSSTSSATRDATSSTPTSSTSSSSALPPSQRSLPLPESPDHQQRQRLHRSSPLTALNSIYVVDHGHVTGKTLTPTCGGGVVNGGFVGDGILTDSWRRVSWRARLRAGIARSTTSSNDQGSPSAAGPLQTAGLAADMGPHGRPPSYLSDVIDSVTFFSNAGGESAATRHARRECPVTSVSVTRCRSDGGEWTLSRNHRDTLTGLCRLASLQVNNRKQRTDHHERLRPPDDTYYTYVHRPT